MAFDQRRTYLCYNNRDLIRDGYIPLIITKEYIPPDTFNINRANNPPKGTHYNISYDDDGQITQVLEYKKLLPASKIKIEIDFSKVMRNKVSHLLTPGSLGFSPIVNTLTPAFVPWGLGGITSGETEITFHLLDAKTVINQSMIVTEEMIEKQTVEIEDGYPISVFGIVKEHIEEVTEDEVTTVEKYGLNFTSEQLESLGKYREGSFEGNARKRIKGATNSDGLFGQIGTPEIKFEEVAEEDQEQLFVKVIRDPRRTMFRGDNEYASGSPSSPFKVEGAIKLDATDSQIRIKTINDAGEKILSVGDKIYLTYSVASRRHLRQTLTHIGKIGQGNTIGVVGFVGAVDSRANTFAFKLFTWKVPSLPSGVENHTVDNLEDIYTSPEQYKISYVNYLDVLEKEQEEEDFSTVAENIEGWRLSEAISDRMTKFWAADHRGILLFDNNSVEVVLARELIRDQEWFTNYLESLPFTYASATGEDGEEVYLESDLAKNIEQQIDQYDESGHLYDVSEVANSFLFDREKIPYYRPFADALREINPYDSSDSTSGVGIIQLDLIGVVDVPNTELEKFDLSFVEFSLTRAQPTKSGSCDDETVIYPYHYWSQNYDAMNDGPGAFYSTGYVTNEIFEWRPDGGTLESYWKQETPYFCGEFSRQTRVYIERMGGNSIDNFSWIYVDTVPFIPHNISLDMDNYSDSSIVVFRDDEVHNSLSYHWFHNSSYFPMLSSVEIDDTRTNEKIDFSSNEYNIIGYNRLLGDVPSYSHGIPLTDEMNRICSVSDDAQDFWFESTDLSSLGLDLNDNPPKISEIPTDWYIKKISIVYSKTSDGIVPDDYYLDFYFEGTGSTVDNVRVTPKEWGAKIENVETGGISIPYTYNTYLIEVDMAYYHGGPINFYGGLWKKIQIESMKIVFTSPNNPDTNRRFDIADYKIDSGQSSVIYDGFGKNIIFYTNEETSNIDAAISYDGGEKWTVHKSIIRLIEGETASMPFVIKDRNGSDVYLFYVLNDSFLMYKKIDTSNFDSSDAEVDPVVPDTYEDGDYDQTTGDPEKEYWGDYTFGGHFIRRSPSYFIAGDSNDEYYKEQVEISQDLDVSNQSILDPNKRQYPRFLSFNDDEDMQDKFTGTPYAVYMQGSGILKVFITIENRLSIKESTNLRRWKYIAQDVQIHKDWVDEDLNKGKIIEVQNIQVVRNDYDPDYLVILYFHDGMLLMRRLNSVLLSPEYYSDATTSDQQIREELELSPDSNNKPIFLIGNIPEDIRSKKIEEIDNGVNSDNSELYVQFYYTKEQIERFDSAYEVDQDTQVYAYINSEGIMRVLYKDIIGQMEALTVNNNRTTPEFWYVLGNS